MYKGSNFPYCVWFGFNLYFPSDQWCWASFMCLLANVVSSLGKCLCRSFVHILIMLFVFKLLSFHRYVCVCVCIHILYIFWMLISYQIYNLWILSPIFCKFSFHLLDGIIWSMKVLILIRSSYLFFSFIPDAFAVISKKLLPDLKSWTLTLMFSSKNHMF